MTPEERIASLEERISALEKAMTREREVQADSLSRAEAVLTNRFNAANEIREAMLDRERNFATRAEFRWAVGSIITFVLVLFGLMMRMIA